MKYSVIPLILFGSLASVQSLSADAAAENATPATAPEGGLEEIVVTAQRRSESMQRVGAPIAAISGDQMISAGIVKPDDLSKVTPGFTVSPSVGGYTEVNIRGVGNFGANAYAEQEVAINFNDVYLARPASINGLFYDIDRVEILKGPQGTLYGRNASAGAVNIIPVAPSFEQNGEAGIEFGNYGLVKINGAFNAPLSDTVAVRIAAQHVKRDGYLSDGYDDDDSNAVRVGVLIKPTADLSLNITADYDKQGGKGDTPVTVPLVDPRNPWLGPSTPLGNKYFSAVGFIPLESDNGFLHNSYYGIAAHLDLRTDFGTLTVIPSFRRTKIDFLSYPGFALTDNENEHEQSAEIRFATNASNPLRAVVGIYYFHEGNPNTLYFNFGQFVTYGIQSLQSLNTDSYAGFGQVTYDLTSSVRLVGGLRFTDESKSQDGTRTGPIQGPCTPPSQIVGDTCVAPVDGSKTFTKVTWKGGIEVDVAPQSLLYANVATGFKTGGFYASLAPNTFEPEILTAYTVGLKNRFLDNRLQVNAEVFYWKYKDQQISFVNPVLPSGVSAVTKNAGQSRVYGFDTDAAYAMTEHDQLQLSVEYLDGRYTQFSYNQSLVNGPPITACAVTPAAPGTVDVNCSGRPMLVSPRWAGSAGVSHRFDLPQGNITAGVSARFSAANWIAVSYTPGMLQSSYTIVDATATYHAPKGRWSAGVYANNIANHPVFTFGQNQPVAGFAENYLAPPRTFGVRLDAKF